MPGLTAKVFRTHNASSTFQKELKKTPVEGTVAEKVLAYNRANRQVAILCNHQRTVSKAHGTQMEKIDDKIMTLKYERHLTRKALLKANPKIKKTRSEIAEEESDMDDDMIKQKKKDVAANEKAKLEKKWEKICEKAKEEGKEKPEKPVYVEKALPDNPERLEKRFDTLSQRIQQAKLQRVDKVLFKTT
jgi:DNA topoisomerase-1